MTVRRFADFATEVAPLDGEKKKITELLDMEILITNYALKKSKYGKNDSGLFLTIQCELDGEKYICFTGSDVLICQFQEYGENVPFLATIKKIDRYYTLS